MNRIILGVTLILAVYYDSRQNRIPNMLCIAAMAAGISYTFCFQGISDGIRHCLWAGGAMVSFFPLWFFRIIGGGDVKLFITAGLLLGADSFSFLICAGTCMGVHAFVLMICRKNYIQRMTLFFQYVMDCMKQGKLEPYPFYKREDYTSGGIRLSYGMMAGHLIAILSGMYH